MDIQFLKAMQRLKNTSDGKLFLAWLDEQEGANYINFLNAPSQKLQEFQGYGNCIFLVKEMFRNTEDRLEKLTTNKLVPEI